MKKILIIGASSAIAEATARIYAERGDAIYLLARNERCLSVMKSDLEIRGARSVDFGYLDVNDFDSHINVLDTAFQILGGIDLVLIAHGTLPKQKACENSFEEALTEINTNAIGTISVLTHIANKLEVLKSGTIAVVTSVAGDRGRKSNYIYGASKGMVSIYLQGLRNRLYNSGINVLDIKPGFVDTPMTADFKKGVLWVKPDVIARCIVKGVDKNKNQVYAPFFWKIIMTIICSIPENVFKRMSM